MQTAPKLALWSLRLDELLTRAEFKLLTVNSFFFKERREIFSTRQPIVLVIVLSSLVNSIACSKTIDKLPVNRYAEVVKDYVGTSLEVGDVVLDSRSKVWVVQPTEPSIVVRGLSVNCKPFTGKGEQTSLPIDMIVKVTVEELTEAPTPAARYNLWLSKTAVPRQAKQDEMRQRHRLFEAIRERHLS